MLQRLLFFSSRCFPAKVRTRLWFTYNSSDIRDGTGSQLQRILSIYFLSRVIRCSYLHSGIEDLTVTQLDHFYEDFEIKKYLLELNDVFRLDNSPKASLSGSDVRTQIHRKLTAINILSALVRLTFNRKVNLVFRVTLPYSIVDKLDFDSSYFSEISQRLSRYHSTVNFDATLVVHLRRGWGREIIAPGETAPRILPLYYYVNAIKFMLSHAQSCGKRIEKVLILTDAPEKPLKFSPPISQLDRWDQNNFTEQHTFFDALPDDELSNLCDLPLAVMRGGNPLIAISIMSQSKYLVLSRSSLGYLSALLNLSGAVLYPPKFWHRKQPKWLELK